MFRDSHSKARHPASGFLHFATGSEIVNSRLLLVFLWIGLLGIEDMRKCSHEAVVLRDMKQYPHTWRRLVRLECEYPYGPIDCSLDFPQEKGTCIKELQIVKRTGEYWGAEGHWLNVSGSQFKEDCDIVFSTTHPLVDPLAYGKCKEVP